MRTIVGAQGEVKIYRIDSIPAGIETGKATKNMNGDHIISHSEKGHHHVLPGGADVMERTDNLPAGMQVFYAILGEPGALTQDAAVSHEAIELDPGIYELRIAREFNPFTEQARRVAD